jgi:hypothetical protein
LNISSSVTLAETIRSTERLEVSSIKIYFEDIEDIKFDYELNQAQIRIMHDPAIYICPKDYYERSMHDRGFVTIHFED